MRALAEEQERLAQCGLAVQSQQLLDEAQAIKSGLPSKLMHAEAELARASGLRLKHPAPGSILMGPRWLLVRAGPSAHARTQSVRRVQCMHAPAACTRQARRVSKAVGGVAWQGAVCAGTCRVGEGTGGGRKVAGTYLPAGARRGQRSIPVNPTAKPAGASHCTMRP